MMFTVFMNDPSTNGGLVMKTIIAGTVLVAAAVAASPAAAQARAIAQAGPMEVSPCKKANGFPGFKANSAAAPA